MRSSTHGWSWPDDGTPRPRATPDNLHTASARMLDQSLKPERQVPPLKVICSTVPSLSSDASCTVAASE